LVATHHPDFYDPSVAEDEAMARDIDALNDEMKAAGVRVFVGGLHPESRANSLRAQPDGTALITDGPYLETKKHIVGLWAGSRSHGRSAGVGAQGRRRLSGAGRGASVSLAEDPTELTERHGRSADRCDLSSRVRLHLHPVAESRASSAFMGGGWSDLLPRMVWRR
jgi:hypothetical protein